MESRWCTSERQLVPLHLLSRLRERASSNINTRMWTIKTTLFTRIIAFLMCFQLTFSPGSTSGLEPGRASFGSLQHVFLMSSCLCT